MIERKRWTPEMDDVLRDGLSNGASHSVIALRLGITRNASIGRAHRLGLSSEPKLISRETIHRLRSEGLTYRGIAAIVGCSPQYAWQIGSGYRP